MLANVLQKIRGFLSIGITPQKLALTFATGACLGTIPLLGTTSLLCLAAALLFRLNLAVIQLVNYLVYPLQLLLFIPFLKVGAHLLSSREFSYSLAQVTQMFAAHPWQTISNLFVINLYGVLLWLLCCPIVFVAVYFGTKQILNKL